MSDQFSDGSAAAFAELPVAASYLKWTRGDAKLAGIFKSDPGLYLGGWRAFVTNQDGEELPKLPIPIVDRSSEDGKHGYKVFASNYINFLPIQHRTRFEKREKAKDQKTGRDYEKVVNVSRERLTGYAPYRQVFGIVYANDSDEHMPAVLKIYKWSAFISFERAGQAWNKISKTSPDGKALIRRYGTMGVKTDDGKLVPNFETYNEGRSTPIEAVGLQKPRFIDITPELMKLMSDSLEWKNCERWNAEGKVQEVVAEVTIEQAEFNKKCAALNLTNIEADQLLAEAGGDYQKAIANLSVDPNTALEAGDDFS
jgi:hypothetical protein